MELDRRSVLRLAGGTAAATMAGTAGCLDTVGLGDGGVPGYASWLAKTDDSDELFYVRIDWEAFEDFEDLADLEEPESDSDGVDEADQMFALPLAGVMLASLNSGFALGGTGLIGLIDDEHETATEFETSVDELLTVDDVVVLSGVVDTDEIDEVLTEQPDDEFGTNTVYEQTTETNGFDIYEPAEKDDDDLDLSFGEEQSVAVGEDAIVLASGSENVDAIDQLQESVAAYAGDGETHVDANDDLEWLLSTAGDGDIVTGIYGDVDEDDLEDDDPLEDAHGIVSSLALVDETEVRAELAAVGDDLDDDAEETIESEFGHTADEAEYDFDGDRVAVSGVWEENVLGE